MNISDICKESTSKSSDDGVCEVNNMLHNVSVGDVSVCANCGKEDTNDNMNTCNKCKMVKYCNAACKKKHRHKHKKDCEEHLRLAKRAAEIHEEEQLFKQPPPAEDCPICFLRLPTITNLLRGSRYMLCCGKEICSGCHYAPVYDDQGNIVAKRKCPFCRVPTAKSNEEIIKRTMKRVEMNDPIAIFNLGVYYSDGEYGYPQDHTNALELWQKAAGLGNAEAYASIGYAYHHGDGVEVDNKKAKYYYELAAMKGDASARYNLGNAEKKAGNIDRAIKHYLIASRSGYSDSLKQIQRIYSNGQATKEDYTKALQLFQTYLAEIKSHQRDEAAAFSDEYRYY